MSRLPRWLRFFGRFAWFLVWHRVALALLVMMIAFLTWFFLEPTWEQRIRLAGGTLELCGLATVAHSMRGTVTLFRKPGQPGPLRKWWSDRPRLVGRVATAKFVAAGLAGVTATGRLEVELRAGEVIVDGPAELEINKSDVDASRDIPNTHSFGIRIPVRGSAT